MGTTHERAHVRTPWLNLHMTDSETQAAAPAPSAFNCYKAQNMAPYALLSLKSYPMSQSKTEMCKV
jgi:hypothetical protein